ncbi:MAG: hypothetical protein H6Q72_4125 [Firmicutes bacterium]|nr:hypothetical protein [Bacillota bacterium]
MADSKITWKDYASQKDANGMAAKVIDILAERNDIIDDMFVVPGNKEYGLQTTQQATDPTVTIRGVNEGATGTKGTFKQLKVEAALFTALGLVDKELVNAAEDKAGFRANVNRPYIGAMGKKLAYQLFKGSKADDAQAFNGLETFYSSTSKEDFGDYVLTADGTGTDNRSIWLIDWGEDSCCAFYPKNTEVGLQHKDYGEELIKLDDGSYWPAYRDLWEWRAGIAVRNYKKVIRIANIDASALSAAGQTSDTSADLLNLMIEAIETIPDLSPRARFYTGRKVKTAFVKKAINKTNAFLTMEEMANKRVSPAFLGVPIRLCEVLDADEDLVS